jgi:hypothetical protein
MVIVLFVIDAKLAEACYLLRELILVTISFLS